MAHLLNSGMYLFRIGLGWCKCDSWAGHPLKHLALSSTTLFSLLSFNTYKQSKKCNWSSDVTHCVFIRKLRTGWDHRLGSGC